MNAIVEGRIETYLKCVMKYQPLECRTILRCIRNLARKAGYALDDRFARAGLAAGPDCRVASGIVDLALGGGGCETAEDTIRYCVKDWLRNNAMSV